MNILILILGLVLGCIDLVIPFAVSLIISLLSKEPSDEYQMRMNVLEMKKQLQAISMVDQFPAYAKLQRKVNTLAIQYKDKANERKSGLSKTKMIVNWTLKILVLLSCLVVLWHHRQTAVVTLPTHLIWPLSPILSFPSAQEGDVSLFVWLSIVRSVASKFGTSFSRKYKESIQRRIGI